MGRINYFFLAPMVVLTSCATHYQKEGIFTNGYSDVRASYDTFVITFRANEMTSSEKVEKYVHRRAQEVTRKNGYSFYTILDKISDSPRDHVHYPSIRLTIQCFKEKPQGIDVIKA